MRGFDGRLALTVLVLCLAWGSRSAQATEGAPASAPSAETGAWFGLPLPGPATEQAIDFADVDLPVIAAPPVQDAPELEGRRVHGYLEEVVKFSYASRDAGDRTWGRLAGTRWAEQTVDYVAGEFRAAGLVDIVKAEVPFLGVDQTVSEWQVRLLGLPEFGAGSADLELRSAFPMSQRPEGPGLPGSEPLPPTVTLAVTAPVVYVGAGTAADLAGKSIQGKIAVMRVEPTPAVFYTNAARLPQQLVNAGAASVIVIYAAPGNMQLHYGSCAKVPCFTLGGEDGEFLLTAIARAAAANVLDKLQLSLSQTLINTLGKKGYLLVGRVRGRNSAENLIVSAHSDGWFAGANDNASGVAALIALARHYGRGHRPAHDMYFILSPGHHSPTASDQRFVQLYPQVCPANIVAINLEHVGQQGVYRSYFNPNGMGPAVSKYGNAVFLYEPVNWDSPGREIMGSPLTAALKAAVVASAQSAQFTAPARIKAGAVAELSALVAAGATGVQDVEVSPWYHSSGDTAATVAPQTLQRALLFYRGLLDRLDKSSRAQVRAGAN